MATVSVEYLAVDRGDAVSELAPSTSRFVSATIHLDCDAIVYAYSDIELDELRSEQSRSSIEYLRRLDADGEFAFHAREVLSRRQVLFSSLLNRMPAQRCTTYFYQSGSFRLEYRSYKRFKPDIELTQSPTTGVSVAPGVSESLIKALFRQFENMGLSPTLANHSIELDGRLAGCELACVLIILVKSRVKGPVLVRHSVH